MTNFYRTLNVLGLLMIAILYVWLGAFDKIFGWEGTVSAIAHKGLPWPALAALCAVAVETVAPLAMFKREWRVQALWVLILYTLATALIFHDFWNGDDAGHSQLLNFFKNFAIAGAMLCLVAQQALQRAAQAEPVRASTVTIGTRSVRQ